MKRVITLAAVVIAIAWCGASRADVNSEVRESMALAAGTYPLVCEPHSASSGNSVLIESVTIPAGGSGTVGVYISNEESIRAFNIPLIIRSIDAGSYMTHLSAAFNEDSRLNSYLNGEYQDTVYIVPIINTYPNYNPGSSSRWDQPRIARPPGPPDYISPDGLLFARFRIMPGNNLPAGSDGTPGDGVPMITVDFQVNLQPGRFEIDTCFTEPSHHLIFIPGTGPVRAVAPEFTKGIVTIEGEGPFIIGDTLAVEEPPETDPEDTLVVDLPIDTAIVADTLVFDLPVDSSGIADADDGKSREMSSGGPPIQRVMNYPNPFNSSTNIRYSLDAQRKVSIVIYDLLGRHVTTLADAYQLPGDYIISWDGRDESGAAVPAGIYFYRFQEGYFQAVGKMVLLK